MWFISNDMQCVHKKLNLLFRFYFISYYYFDICMTGKQVYCFIMLYSQSGFNFFVDTVDKG